MANDRLRLFAYYLFKSLNATLLPWFDKLMAKVVMSIDNNPRNKIVNESKRREVATNTFISKYIQLRNSLIYSGGS